MKPEKNGLAASGEIEPRDLFADERSYTIREFCEAERISASTYHKWRRDGRGPRELRIPGSPIVRITARARAEWQRRMEEVNDREAPKLKDEHEARAERLREAGRRSGAARKRPKRRAPAQAGA